MANEIALTKEQKSVLFNPAYTGIQTGSNVAYPPVINVLQSDKQYKAFGDEEMSNKDYGKLFVRTDTNTKADLKEELVGSAIKIEVGHEVRTDDSKIISSDNYLLNQDDKEDYKSQGYRAQNMVKVLLAMGSAKEVADKMKEYEKLVAAGRATKADFPFAVLVIKGSSWGSWLEAQNKMEELCQREYHTSATNSIASLFKFSMRSKKEHSQSFGDYYSTEVGVELNGPEEAAAFAPMVVAMKDYGLFYKVADRIADKSEDEDLDAVFEGVL